MKSAIALKNGDETASMHSVPTSERSQDEIEIQRMQKQLAALQEYLMSDASETEKRDMKSKVKELKRCTSHDCSISKWHTLMRVTGL